LAEEEERVNDGDRPWQVTSRETIYTSPWVNLHRDTVQLPDGGVIEGHHVLEYPREAVGVVPLGNDGRVLLIKHYRFITDTCGWEIPAGCVEPGEAVVAAAQRELLEETGYVSRWMYKLGEYHPSNGSSNQRFHIYVARRLEEQGLPTDINETMGINWFSGEEVRQHILENRIVNGLALTGLLWAMAAGELDGCTKGCPMVQFGPSRRHDVP
jgi:8-oxo-dGTP pyrophosphatase MutT (NUDIX family)